MSASPRIILNNLSFTHPQASVNFKDINLTFESGKYGVVGKNGIGKTTFLKLITGSLPAISGNILREAVIAEFVQNDYLQYSNTSIAKVLGVDNILQALLRIHEGEINEKDFETVNDQWRIELKIKTALKAFNLWPLSLNRSFDELSGGQKTKLLLAKVLIFKSDFMIFDEPTNNLDAETRKIFYDFIETQPKNIIVVSHDCSLLNHCNKIIEITQTGIHLYGGNYDFYKAQKHLKEQALEQAFQTKISQLSKSKVSIQKTMERHEKNAARGNKEKARQIKGIGSYNKIELKSKKGQSEQTNRRLRNQANRKLTSVNEQLDTAKKTIEMQKKLNVVLPKDSFVAQKKILELHEVCFCYEKNKPLIQNFSITVRGSERVALTGSNGSGKSTLVKLICGMLTAQNGKVNLNTDNIAYFDQSVSFLDASLSLLDNFIKLHPGTKQFAAYKALAAFNFRNKAAEKKIMHLSEGEKMRAGLAMTLLGDKLPELIILDEPTNHLDLTTIEVIEQAIAEYSGAVLAICHDKDFLQHIHIQREVALESD